MAKIKAPKAPPSYWAKFITLPWRLGISFVAGGLAAWLASHTMAPLTRSIAGWDAFALTNLILIVVSMRQADTADDIRRVAASEDLPRVLASVVIIGGALASLVAVVGLLGTLKNLPEEAKALHLALGVGAVAFAWTMVHVVFTLRYAHAYYRADEQGEDAGGLVFPEEESQKKLEPNYLDFAYFSFVVGMTAQTADIGISSRSIRSICLLHGLISFVFNTAIVALTIGTIGGVLN